MLSKDRVVTTNQSIRHAVSTWPDKPFIIHNDQSISYAQMGRLTAGFAAYLSGRGVKKGDRVCMLLPRCPELILTMLALNRLGAYAVPVNYTVSPAEVIRYFDSSKPAGAVIHKDFAASLDRDALSGRSSFNISVGGQCEGMIPFESACSAIDDGIMIDDAPEDIAYLNYTTGSSGNPKGALCTHENIYFNTLASVEALGIGHDDVHLCMFASFAHPHELYARPLYTGGSLVLLEHINPKTISRTITSHGISCMMGLAPMYDMLATHCADKGINSLRVAESGGMYTNPDLNKKFMSVFGIPVLSVWGSTETTGIAIANRPDNFRTDGSAGIACPHYDVKIVDDDGNDAPAGEPGELVFKGRGVISGYYDSDAFSCVDGWYQSGDIARMDAEGFVYFMDRKSGMIKVAGLKVYPLQVENALLKHPGIKEAAVLGDNDRLRGKVPRAFIVPEDGHTLKDEEIRKFCLTLLADYMVPRKFDYVAELPKIGSGKINKKELQKIYNL